MVDFKEFTGLRNDRPSERFVPSDLVTADNVDIDNSGAVARRSGYTAIPTVAAGAKHSLWADPKGRFGFYVQGATLYSLNPDLTASTVRTDLTAGQRMAYRRILDRVYYSNGAQSGIVELNGAARSWGLPVPPLPGVALTVGSMLAGAYQYVLTYVRNDGQESGATLAGRFDVALDGGGLAFTLPVSTDPSVTSKNLYMSTRNGDVLYLVANLPNAQGSLTYTGDTSEFNLPLLTQFLSGPPAGHLIGYYRGRAYVAVGDTLYPSEEYAYELFDLRKGIPLDGRVTLFAPLDEAGDGGLFLGTTESHGALIGKGPSDFQYVPKVDYGAVEGALTYVDGSLYGDDSLGARMLPMWLSTQGVCVGLLNMEIRNLTRTKYAFTVGQGKGAGLFVAGPNKLVLSCNY